MEEVRVAANRHTLTLAKVFADNVKSLLVVVELVAVVTIVVIQSARVIRITIRRQVFFVVEAKCRLVDLGAILTFVLISA